MFQVSPEAKDGLLSWMEACLQANRGRAGLWHLQGAEGGLQSIYASDGFMINLGAVMLHLAQPFTQDVRTAKILKVGCLVGCEVSLFLIILLCARLGGCSLGLELFVAVACIPHSVLFCSLLSSLFSSFCLLSSLLPFSCLFPLQSTTSNGLAGRGFSALH